MNEDLFTASAGSVAHRSLSVASLPTGAEERLPVTVVEGAGDGPVLWVVAGVHGDEPTGVVAAQRFVAALDPEHLDGRVVTIPCFNPSGVRRTERTSEYHGHDPNRRFPTGREDGPVDDAPADDRLQARIGDDLFAVLAASADALVTLHSSWVGSTSYTIRPRVSYGETRDRAAASRIASDIRDLATAFGFPPVNQFPADETARRSLDRSLAGAAVLRAGVPAITAEIGGRFAVDPEGVDATVAGLDRTLRMLGIHPGPSPEEPVIDPPADGPHRRAVGPVANQSGFLQYRVEPGAIVDAGDVVAAIVDAHGREHAKLRAPADGYVLSYHEGVTCYESDPVADLAVTDETPLVYAADRSH